MSFFFPRYQGKFIPDVMMLWHYVRDNFQALVFYILDIVVVVVASDVIFIVRWGREMRLTSTICSCLGPSC